MLLVICTGCGEQDISFFSKRAPGCLHTFCHWCCIKRPHSQIWFFNWYFETWGTNNHLCTLNSAFIVVFHFHLIPQFCLGKKKKDIARGSSLRHILTCSFGATSLIKLWKHCFIWFLIVSCMQGCFEVLSLSGSYTFVADGDAHRKKGTLSVSLAEPNGRVFGGVLEGSLIAAGPIQVRKYQVST